MKRFRTRISRELGPSSDNVMKPEQATGDIVLDLSGVSYLDRHGAGVVAWLEAHLKAHNARLGVVASNAHAKVS